MLTVHLLGHAHVTYNHRPVPLSAKAVALITYLTIEKLPQHRERLADLLWNTPEARKNLRVELARIRSAGLHIFPLSRQLLYLEHVGTDLDVWLSQLGSEMDQAGLAQWLSTLRGVPLSGLEDLGSPAFQEWIDHQRWVLTEQTEEVLGRAYGRFQRAGKPWATRAIGARAEALGFGHPGEFAASEFASGGDGMGGLDGEWPASGAGPSGAAGPTAGTGGLTLRPTVRGNTPDLSHALQMELPEEPLPPEALHFGDQDREAALRASLDRAAQQPQLVVLHGPTGSGKSYGAGRALAESGWLALRVSNSRVGRLVLATLAQSLLGLEGQGQPATTQMPAAQMPEAALPDGPQVSPHPAAGRFTGDITAGDVAGHASGAETLRDVLLRPGSLEEDVVKVATVLATVPRPVAIVLDHAQNAPVELASLLEFLLNVPAAGPRALALLSRTPPAQAPLCRALLRRFAASQCLVLEMTPLSVGSVKRALTARGAGEPDPHARAAVMLQRSEGNALHLVSLLEQHDSGAPASVLPGAAPGGRLPAAVKDTYLGEIDGWPAPLRDALGSLSVIQGDFSFALAGSFPDAARRGLTPAALLRGGLERRALVEAEPPGALVLPAFGPVDGGGGGVGGGGSAEPYYRFRSEGLRVALASGLPHAERQDLRRHLAAALEASQPGLAHYYAERAGADADAERLCRVYHARLPQGSPLRQLAPSGTAPSLVFLSQSNRDRPSPRPAAEPRRTRASASATVSRHGYLLSWEQGGWLSVTSQGRYGHPQILRLHLPLPAGLRGVSPLSLRLVWRLDVCHCGHELGPGLVPFPLRISVPGADAAQVLTPEALPDYAEEGQRHQVHTDVTLGTWMEHELDLVAPGRAADHLELSVRALDLALTIAELSVNGQPLLPLTALPGRLGQLLGREAVAHAALASPGGTDIKALG